MKKGKLLIPNEDRCTITICDIDEDVVLPSAKKVKRDRDGKDTITDNEIQTSEIKQTLDTGCQTDKAYFVSAESLNDEEKSFLENIICFPAGKYKLKQRRTATLKRHSILLKRINVEI